MIKCYVIGGSTAMELLCRYLTEYSITTLCGRAVLLPCESNSVTSLFPDIVFIEADLLKENSGWLEKLVQTTHVVIISDGTEQAFSAFEALAFDFLVNPVSYTRFVRSINKFDHFKMLANAKSGKPVFDSFYIRDDSLGSREILISCEKVMYIKALQNYVTIYLDDGTSHSSHISMKEIEEILSGSQFSRIHKSFIINERKISSVDANSVTLKGKKEERIQIGNTYKKDFFDRKAWKTLRKKVA